MAPNTSLLKIKNKREKGSSLTFARDAQSPEIIPKIDASSAQSEICVASEIWQSSYGRIQFFTIFSSKFYENYSAEFTEGTHRVVSSFSYAGCGGTLAHDEGRVASAAAVKEDSFSLSEEEEDETISLSERSAVSATASSSSPPEPEAVIATASVATASVTKNGGVLLTNHFVCHFQSKDREQVVIVSDNKQ